MIDSTKTPVPAWKRYATMAVLVVLLLVAGYVIYTKDIRHSSTGSTSSPAATVAVPAKAPAKAPAKPTPTTATTATTLAGGIAPSTRDPFAG